MHRLFRHKAEWNLRWGERWNTLNSRSTYWLVLELSTVPNFPEHFRFILDPQNCKSAANKRKVCTSADGNSVICLKALEQGSKWNLRWDWFLKLLFSKLENELSSSTYGWYCYSENVLFVLRVALEERPRVIKKWRKHKELLVCCLGNIIVLSKCRWHESRGGKLRHCALESQQSVGFHFKQRLHALISSSSCRGAKLPSQLTCWGDQMG